VLCVLWGVGSMWIELELEYGVVERRRRRRMDGLMK
jgi:hypothetical protein